MSFRGLVELELQSCDLRIGYIPSGPFGVSHSGRLDSLGLVSGPDGPSHSVQDSCSLKLQKPAPDDAVVVLPEEKKAA